MNESRRYQSGELIARREILHGQLWMDHPVTVVRDDGDQVAVLLRPGSEFRFHPHPFGRHPWADQSCWVGPEVLQIYRSNTLYSVWMFFEGGRFQRWYVNLEAPINRGPDGLDTDDYGLDLIVEPDGSRHDDQDPD